MRVLILGAGLMGSQIGCEYALGGHEVTLVSRNPDRVEERVGAALRTVREHDLFSAAAVAAARSRVRVGSRVQPDGWDLALESVPENLGLKAEILRPIAEASGGSILATNTSSLSITRLGEEIGAPERTIGTHYWNPPLLMPLVELVAGDRTDPAVVGVVQVVLKELGKRPVRVERDVPGFLWNRLQVALLRECVWLVENGVASPKTVDDVVRFGLARRWRYVGPFQSIALGGIETWNRVVANLAPELSTAQRLPDLRAWIRGGEDVTDARDRALAGELRRERNENQRASNESAT